jgi:predicted HicB family RNase H-like nuclease
MAKAIEQLSTTATRVAMLIRMQLPVRNALRNRVVAEHASMNHYLEQLITEDLHGLRTGAFVAVHPPTFTARGKNGTGRPTKGARAAVMLRVEPALRERMRERAASLNLTVNDYLESLVSQDISAAASSGEEMIFDQTA